MGIIVCMNGRGTVILDRTGCGGGVSELGVGWEGE